MQGEPPVRALVCRVGQEPVVEDIQTDLDALQALVGGYIECVPLDDVDVWCNEDGRMLGLALNRRLGARAPEARGVDVVIKLDEGLADPGEMGVYEFRGDIFLAGRKPSGAMASLSDEAIAKYRELLALDRSAVR
jgi:hypothetical protein